MTQTDTLHCMDSPEPDRRSPVQDVRTGERVDEGRPAAFTQGFTLLELLVVMAIIGVLLSVSALSLNSFQRPALSDSRSLASAVKAARSSAVASTSPMRKVSPSLKRWSNWLPSGRNSRSRL